MTTISVRAWSALLGAAVVFAAGAVSGQVMVDRIPSEVLRRPPFEQGNIVFPIGGVLSGADLGFKVEGHTAAGVSYGRLVLRADNQWIDVELASQ